MSETRSFETILYSKHGPVAEIILDRPHVLNAHNIQMRDDLYGVLEAVRDDDEVHCMILRGMGERAFCTGADLSEFGTAPSRVIARQVRWERDLWGMLQSIPKPTIAALHGYVLGSGLEMSLLCDLRIASDDAIFGMPEAALGMTPVASGTQTMPRNIGIAKTMEMLLSNQRYNSSRALEIGLVHRVVEKNNLVQETAKLAEALSSYDPKIVGAIKRSINRGMDLSIGKALELEMNIASLTMSLDRNDT